MVQGLGFLSKKSWHVKNIANQEKVWMAEQRKAEEERKTKELAKQIQQEREQDELDRIAGRKRKTDRGIDWMYQNAERLRQDEADRNAEDFLLGKQYVADKNSFKSQSEGDAATGIHAVVMKQEPVAGDDGQDQYLQQPQGDGDQKAAGSDNDDDRKMPASANDAGLAADVVSRNEQFRLSHEDPMYMVQMQQREMEQRAEKQSQLYEKVTGIAPIRVRKGDNGIINRDKDERRRERKERKRRKKEKKRMMKEKKREKKRKRRRDYDDSEDDRESDGDDDKDNGDDDSYEVSMIRGISLSLSDSKCVCSL